MESSIVGGYASMYASIRWFMVVSKSVPLTIESIVSPAILSAVTDLISILSIVSIPSPGILPVTRSERLVFYL
jgi:hypothetical protein